MLKLIEIENVMGFPTKLKQKSFFNTKDLFFYFHPEKYKFPPQDDFVKDYGACNSKDLCAKMFKTAFQKIVDDIVEENITLRIPSHTDSNIFIGMKAVTGDAFIGKTKNLDYDPVNANFTLYRVYLTYMTPKQSFSKEIYVGRETNERIDKYAQNGKIYY